jgi:hypothetical protein
METSPSANSAEKYNCLKCNTKCFKKNDWNRHLVTAKHMKEIVDNLELKIAQKDFICICGKTYRTKSGLWKHNKNCKFTINDDVIKENKLNINVVVKDNSEYLADLVIEVVKNNKELQQQNQEFQKQMLELYKNANPSMNNSNNSNNHSYNKTFNMQVFLNEQCKDAMNIMEFVDTFKLEFSDLEKVGEVGYVEGMSNIIIQKLNEIDIYKRPIHCSDAKRETMYVKDKNVWEKDNSTHDRLRLAIRYISKKNTDMLLTWCHAHPGSCDSDNILNDIYLEIVRQAMGGRDLEENENKIMRKIAKTVLIDK